MTFNEMIETMHSLNQLSKFNNAGVEVRVHGIIRDNPRIAFYRGKEFHSLDMKTSSVERVWKHFIGFCAN